MTVFQAINSRRSIRKYKDKKVGEDKLERILEAARLSPSARNLQTWKFIVVREEETRKKLVEAINQPFVGQAPVILVNVATETEGIMRCGEARYTVDLSIATAYMILQAQEEGLGTCWLGSFDQEKVKEILSIPKEMKVVSISPLGYPDEAPDMRPRKEFEEVVSFDKF